MRMSFIQQNLHQIGIDLDDPEIIFFKGLERLFFNDPSVRTSKDTAPISPSLFCLALTFSFLSFFVLLLNNLSHFNFHRTQVSIESRQITLIVIPPSHGLTNLFCSFANISFNLLIALSSFA